MKEKCIHLAMHVETERLGVTFDYGTKTKHTLKVRKGWKSTAIYLGESH